MPTLHVMVFEDADAWRLHIGADPPVDTEPMKVKLKPNNKPFRRGRGSIPNVSPSSYTIA